MLIITITETSEVTRTEVRYRNLGKGQPGAQEDGWGYTPSPETWTETKTTTIFQQKVPDSINLVNLVRFLNKAPKK